MGLDLSLTSTGISVNGSTRSIRSKNKGIERLIEIKDGILAVAQAESVGIVAIEGYSYASQYSQAHSIGELGGVVKVAIRGMGLPMVIIPPTCRAKFATGKGNSGKLDVVASITAKTGLLFTGADGNDRCDAWILEQMTLTYLGLSTYEWNQDQLLGLKKCNFAELEEGNND